MTQIHQYHCDLCKKKAASRWNGEHWLAPEGWVDLVDNNMVRNTGLHLCNKCVDKTFKLKPFSVEGK